MKKMNTVKNCENKCLICTTRQKVLFFVAMFGIFFCGVMAGAVLWRNGAQHYKKPGATLREIVAKSEHEFAKRIEEIPCKMREKALLVNISNPDDGVPNAADMHEQNARVYNELVTAGCEENKGKYRQLVEAESDVARVLRNINNRNETTPPCKVVEDTLLSNLVICPEAECHEQNARVYSKIVEDGCPENAAAYKQKAINELQIAEGVRMDMRNVSGDEMRGVVDTYRKLQMQQEAKKYIKKVEKMVNPGIDFIMELQRIIEE